MVPKASSYKGSHILIEKLKLHLLITNLTADGKLNSITFFRFLNFYLKFIIFLLETSVLLVEINAA